MVNAVYYLLDNGNYKFLAAFSSDGDFWDTDICKTYAEECRNAGEDVLIVPFDDLSQLTDFYTLADEQF